jgi:hypothetical protein
LLFGSFLLLTSAYCLLLYIPFAYLGFLQDPAMNWIYAFLLFHAPTYGALLVVVGVSLETNTRRRSAGS